jgi:hypothetical protein
LLEASLLDCAGVRLTSSFSGGGGGYPAALLNAVLFHLSERGRDAER